MTIQPSRSGLVSILTHVLVWTVFGVAVFFRHPIFSGMDISYQLWVTQIVTLALLVVAFYFNTSVLVPKLLLRNQFIYYSIIFVAIVGFIVFVNAWVEIIFPKQIPDNANDILIPGTHRPRLNLPPLGRRLNTLTMIISAMVLLIGTSITVIQKWQKDKALREELEKEKVSSELSFLKAQINPHFFFNTLNNIYALTQVDGNAAGKAIYQLSRMMRYLLYETQQGTTMLGQELNFVKDYISLMQLRLTDIVTVIFEMPAQILDRPMAPMILLPFVENAFKHGVSATDRTQISIIIIQNGDLDITVRNSIVRDNHVNLETNSGIGLTNTRRRLDLLYRNKYTLDIFEDTNSNVYTIHLTLDLT